MTEQISNQVSVPTTAEDAMTLVSTISPSTSYIAIAKIVTDAIRASRAYVDVGGYQAICKMIIAMLTDGAPRMSSVEVFMPPIPDPSGKGGDIIARFWYDCRWRKGGDVPMHFRCKLVLGSPGETHPFTLVLTALDIQDDEVAP